MLIATEKRQAKALEERHIIGSNKYSSLKSISYAFKNPRYSAWKDRFLW
jgi:hypothetical protein